MKKKLFVTILFLSLYMFSHPIVSYADTTTSCFTTKVGTPGSNQTAPALCGAGPVAQKAIEFAKAQIPRSVYVFATPTRNWSSTGQPGPSAPTTYDCSGLVGWAYYWASGGKISMIGQTSSDWAAANNSPKYQRHFKSENVPLQPGDIVYFAGSDGTLNPPNPGHVGLYEGPGGQGVCAGKNDCVIHINVTGNPPHEQTLSSMYGDYIGFLRPMVQ